MELLKLLFSIIFITLSFPEKMFTEARFIYRISNEIEPQHYKIQLNIDVENNIFYGISNINITIYKQTQTISLHSINLIILQSTIKDIINEIKLTKSLYITKEVITLYFDSDLPPGTYILHIEFMGIISDTNDIIGGFYKYPYINEEGDIE